MEVPCLLPCGVGRTVHLLGTLLWGLLYYASISCSPNPKTPHACNAPTAWPTCQGWRCVKHRTLPKSRKGGPGPSGGDGVEDKTAAWTRRAGRESYALPTLKNGRRCKNKKREQELAAAQQPVEYSVLCMPGGGERPAAMDCWQAQLESLKRPRGRCTTHTLRHS